MHCHILQDLRVYSLSQSAIGNVTSWSHVQAHHKRHAFSSVRPRTVTRCSRDQLQTKSNDNLDDVVLHTLLPHTRKGTDDRGTGDIVLRKRVEALRQRAESQDDATDAPSTSGTDQDDSLLPRVSQQLRKLNPNRLSPRIRGLILLNILVLLCGANWVVLKETEDFFDPFTFAALRFTLAAAVFSPWVGSAVKDRAILTGGLELGIWSALAYMTQSVGLVTSDASRASFISTFTVSVFTLPAHTLPLLAFCCF